MMILLLDWLQQAWGVKAPSVFYYYSTRMILAAATSLLISIFFGPLFIRQLTRLKIGQTIRSEHTPLLGVLHGSKKDTPTMGGILILFSICLSLLLWMDLHSVFTLILFLTMLLLGGLGAYDDYQKIRYRNTKGISAKTKLTIQLMVGGMLCLYLFCPAATTFLQQKEWFITPQIKEQALADGGNWSLLPLTVQEYASRLYVPFFKEPMALPEQGLTLLSILLTLFVVTGSSNAVNLTDGLDGLAAGCLIMVAACFAAIAFVSNHVEVARYLNILYIEGSGEIAIFLSALVGGCLGFLWYNGHPAQVFMGDTGSLALGGLVGVSAVLLKRELLLGIVGGIFVAEALSVIVQVVSFRLRGKRVFLCAPLHHHFEYKGWPETKVVVRFWIVGLLLALMGIGTLKFQ